MFVVMTLLNKWMAPKDYKVDVMHQMALQLVGTSATVSVNTRRPRLQRSPRMIDVPKKINKRQHLRTDYNDYVTEDELFCNDQKLRDR